MGVIKKGSLANGASFQIIALNTREDLLNDFNFFIDMAGLVKVNGLEGVYAQQRWLRAALLILFAYIEAVVNGWVYRVLESHKLIAVFKRMERSPLEQKIEFLYDAFSARPTKLNIEDAKGLRNLFVHFTPHRDSEAFDKLTLETVKSAADHVDRWMNEMESITGMRRHPFSEELKIGTEDFNEPTGEAEK